MQPDMVGAMLIFSRISRKMYRKSRICIENLESGQLCMDRVISTREFNARVL